MKSKKLILIIIALLIVFSIMIYFMTFSNTETEQIETEQIDTISEIDTGMIASYEDEDLDVTYEDSNISYINLKGSSISVENSTAKVNGTIVTIESAGEYYITGTLNDGQIIVNIGDSDKVHLIFKDVTINCSNSSPIYIENADKTIITIEGNNTLTDSSKYIYTDSEETEPDATIFSHDDLTINGTGTLNINANYKDGIASKDDLIIVGTTINIKANDDGIRGKDSVIIKEAIITATVTGDCIKSTNDTDAEKGYIIIDSGTFNLTTNGNTENSSKGIKAISNITINNGTFKLNTTDDSIHSNNNIVINDGSFEISTGDDGFHSDTKLSINGGKINISKCYEGIESAEIVISNGEINIVADDDGLNGAGGNDSTQSTSPMGGPTNDMFSSSTGKIFITGGVIKIKSGGDGIDVNGNIIISGGTIYTYTPDPGNGPIDYDGTFTMTGGNVYVDDVIYTTKNISELTALISSQMPGGGNGMKNR